MHRKVIALLKLARNRNKITKKIIIIRGKSVRGRCVYKFAQGGKQKRIDLYVTFIRLVNQIAVGGHEIALGLRIPYVSCKP